MIFRAVFITDRLAGRRSIDQFLNVSTESFRELPGLRVEVEEVLYQPQLEAPPDRPHPFIYFISIINGSTKAVTIRGRKWVLRDAEGDLTVVEGSGVVGEVPHLAPGEQFSYNSYHVIKSDSTVQGSFFGDLVNGQRVRISIPPFTLKTPAE